MNEVLIACVGNIFRGDDGFGVEVARRLREKVFPDGVRVIDYGICGIDLTYALLDKCDAAILVDATRQAKAPGTLHVMEPEPGISADCSPEELLFSAHDLDPESVLAAVSAMNGRCRRVVLVGCEPADLGDEFDGKMGLTEPVLAAVEEAVTIIPELVRLLRDGELNKPAGVHSTLVSPHVETGGGDV